MLRKITEFRFITRSPLAAKYPSWRSTRVISPTRLHSMSVQGNEVENSQVLPVSQTQILRKGENVGGRAHLLLNKKVWHRANAGCKIYAKC